MSQVFNDRNQKIRKCELDFLVALDEVWEMEKVLRCGASSEILKELIRTAIKLEKLRRAS